MICFTGIDPPVLDHQCQQDLLPTCCCSCSKSQRPGHPLWKPNGSVVQMLPCPPRRPYDLWSSLLSSISLKCPNIGNPSNESHGICSLRRNPSSSSQMVYSTLSEQDHREELLFSHHVFHNVSQEECYLFGLINSTTCGSEGVDLGRNHNK